MKQPEKPQRAYKPSHPQTEPVDTDIPAIPIEEISGRLDEIRQSPEDGPFFIRLYDCGDIVFHNKDESTGEYSETEDHSKADFGLAVLLAKWFNGDRAKIDTAFRHSKLMRDKWDERRGRQTYGRMTIDTAVEFYLSSLKKDEEPKKSISPYPKTLSIQEVEWFLRYKREPKTFLESDTYAWITGFCNDSIGLFDQYASLFRRAALDAFDQNPSLYKAEEHGGLSREEFVDREIQYFRELTFHTGERNLIMRSILDLAADEQEADKVSVACFPCGAGKSTAISYLIREVIQHNDGQGLLIVTDRKERFPEYTYFDAERDPELSGFLEDHQDRITVMTADNYREAYASQYHTPILMMTTQRYFDSDPDELRQFFRWEGGPRPLVIFDEECPLSEAVEVSIGAINDVDTALRASVMDGTEDRDWCVKQWDALKEEYIEIGERYEAICKNKNRVFHQAKRQNLTEDDDRFFAYFRAHKGEIISQKDKAFETVRAVRQLLTGWGICSCQKLNAERQGDKYHRTFYTFLDNRRHVQVPGVKFIILDGTGDISPVYRESFVAQPHQFREHFRSLNNLTIKLVDAQTNRKNLSHAPKRELERNLQEIKEYIESLPDLGSDPTLFVYMEGAEPYFRKHLIDLKQPNQGPNWHIEHLGNVKGKNTFKDASCIIQVGLNRLPEDYYFAFVLGHDDKFREQLAGTSYDETPDMIEAYLKEDTVKVWTDEMLLTDIEQNMYRGLIRSPILTKSMTFYILFRLRLNERLVDMIRKRYNDDEGFHQARIILLPMPPLTELRKIRNRKKTNGVPSAAQKFVAFVFDGGIEHGRIYSAKELCEACGITRTQFDAILDQHAAIREYIDRHRIKKDVYMFP